MVILGKNYHSYETALAALSLERLDSRRASLCHRFALKVSQSLRHKSMFPANPNFRANMRNPKPFKEHLCKTSRYYNSAIPYLARLLNKKTKAP
jgi:hypothetical protein